MNSRERVATSLAAFTACLLGTVCSVQAGGDATWDGGYIGSFIGGGTGDVLKAGDLTAEFNRTGVGLFSGTDELNGDDVSGLLTGGVVGQNFQRGGIVYGWEADLTLADIDATQSIATAVADPPGQGIIVSQAATMASLDWYTTLRGRVGGTVNNALVYATGGVALGEIDLYGATAGGGSVGGGPAGNFGKIGVLHDSNLEFGWVVGGGIDYMLSDNLVLNLAYQYVNFGDVTGVAALERSGTDGTARATADGKADIAINTLRAGLSWRFGQDHVNPYMPGAMKLGTALASADGGWAGAYAGLFAGVGFADVLDDTQLDAFFARTGTGLFAGTESVAGDDDTGLLLGGVAGYNLQRGSLVYGLETDFTAADIDATSPIATAVADPNGQGIITAQGFAAASLDWFYTLRARLGYASDRYLVYATGGLALAEIDLFLALEGGGSTGAGPNGPFGILAPVEESSIEVGWVVGGGVDYKIRDNMVFNFGYQYVEFASLSEMADLSSTGNDGTANATLNGEADIDIHVIRAGLSWRR